MNALCEPVRRRERGFDVKKSVDCVASVVLYNNPPEMVRAAAMSFLRTALDVRLYVVDNSPVPVFKSVFEDLPAVYQFNGGNLGYGRAHNRAIFNAEPSRYHLIINPDIVIPEGSLEKLVQFMDSRGDVGIVCPKFLNTDGTVQHLNKREANVLDLALRGFLPATLRPLVQRRLDRYEMKDQGYDTAYEVPFMPGAFMLCRTDVLKNVGGFDPRYFLYFEDADLSRKFQDYGQKTVYYPGASVIHRWERAPHKSAKMAFILIVNGIRYFNKWGWKFA